MPNGTVKWFNANKGYGFIEPEGGAKDVFVHISAVEAAGMNTLNDGAKISFELETGKNGKEAAVNIQPLWLMFLFFYKRAFGPFFVRFLKFLLISLVLIIIIKKFFWGKYENYKNNKINHGKKSF